MNNNRIQAIKNYLEQYRRLDVYWKDLLKESYQYYEVQLLKEYERIREHPYPQEYNSYVNHITTEISIPKWLIISC